MKQLLRYFSVGLFTAGIILLIGLFFFDEKSIEEYSAEELIPIVEDGGYYVLSSEEYITLTVPSSNSTETAEAKEEPAENAEQEENNTEENNKEANAEETSTEETNKEETENKVTDEESANESTSYTLSIEPGMLTSEISSLLEENNIIEDSFEFDQYLNENDYSEYVQLGEFDLTSDMSFYEIAETIAN